MGLFRKEVFDKPSQNSFGDIILASPISHKMVIALLAVIMVGIIVFSTVGEYSRKERVVGFLSSDKGLIEVRPVQTGVIEKVQAKIGQDVKRGDFLFSIKTETFSPATYVPASNAQAYDFTPGVILTGVVPGEHV